MLWWGQSYTEWETERVTASDPARPGGSWPLAGWARQDRESRRVSLPDSRTETLATARREAVAL